MWLRCLLRSPAAFAPAVSAEFHQDTVNRVTVNAGHFRAADRLRDHRRGAAGRRRRGAPPAAGALNQEVALYVRYAAKFRTPAGLKFLRRLYLPQGAGWMARMLGYMAIGAVLRRVDPKRRIAI
ncbi:hypothetical protein AB5I41_17410 [Sphingomonas sp. MMS24-JH45]